ncbi:MAG: autotransporter domain-containing protein [Planctomycetia bacterium]|nr:autotransporter domain-containing protein [Planctomycetia bacterium]
MNKGKVRKSTKQRRESSLTVKRRRLLASLLLGMILSGGGSSLQAADYTNVTIDDTTGAVTVKEGQPYSLLSGEYVPGSDYQNLTFGSTTESFINGGGIGYSGESTTDPVVNINAGGIGGFTNNGQIDFTGTMTLSSAGLINNGQIEGNATGGVSSGGTIQNGPATGDPNSLITGKITAVGEIKNYGTLDGLDETSVLSTPNAGIINGGAINDYSQITADSLTNSTGGTITGDSTLSITSSLTNYGSISSATEDEGSISAPSLINQVDGEIIGFNSITAADSLINQGTIDSVTTINAPVSLANNGTISNVDSINAQTSLVNNGTLENIGTITGKTRLENSGILKMTGDAKVTKFDTGSLAINGGTLQVRLAPVSGGEATPGVDNDVYDAQSADLTVTGGVISVVTESEPGGEFSVGDRYTVIQGRDITVTEELSAQGDTGDELLRFVTSYDNDNYYLDVARAVLYGPMGTTENSQNMGNYIDTLGNNYVKGSDLEEVLLALDQYTDGDPDLAQYALAQIDGAVYGSMATMEIQNMTIVNNTLANYLRPQDVFCCSQNYDPCCPTGMMPCPGLKMWGTYYGVNGDVDSDGNAFGGDYSVNGVLAGGDFSITPSFRFGGFFAYGDTEYQVNGLNEQANADSYKAGLYFVRSTNNGYLFGNFNYGWDNFSTIRNISFLERTNTGKTSGTEWAGRLEKGFNIPLARSIFQPFGAFQYLSLTTDAFSEEGTGATALNIDESEYNSYRSELGGRLLWAFEGQRRTGNLFLQSSWIHEFGDTRGTVTSSFNNQNNENYTGDYKYNVYGVDLGTDWCNLGVGGNITQNNFTLFGGYDFLVNDTQNLHTGRVGLAWQF